VCGQDDRGAGGCRNHWCQRADRYFSSVWSLAPLAGPWRWAVWRFKYRGEKGWAAVFARLLVGFLDDRMPWFDSYDVLVPMPSCAGTGARRPWDHVGAIASAMGPLCGDRWPIRSGAVGKVSETPAFAGLSLAQRRACAESSLRRSLRVQEPDTVAGARILVLDDVFTEGSTLREVARALRRAGAIEVAGLVIARQPWSGPTGAGERAPAARP
jgi:predicted amidophosphoribosyltransferase